MRTVVLLACALLTATGPVAQRHAIAQGSMPVEPLEIGTNPQWLFDDWTVDNHWAIKYKTQAVERVFHTAEKHPASPIMTGDQPSYVWVVRDSKDGLFRMWYQANFRNDTVGKGRKFETHIAYAESADGVHWGRPDLNLFPWHTAKPNNIVLGRPDHHGSEACAPVILDLPERDRRGFRYVLMYRNKGAGGGQYNGIRLIGSHDGIHWDPESDTRIAEMHSDHHNAICYDPVRDEYVMYCRAKHIYRTFRGDIIDTGASRRIARMTSPTLWTDWFEHGEPQTILIPDEIDNRTNFNFFYGMPARYHAGVYWGFLEPFRMNDFIYTELAVSRDGVHYLRHPDRAKLIDYGPEGSWDDEMIFASPAWVEVGDQWWIYYTGWDGPHGTPERTGAVGLATIRKEGLISMHGPANGGVIATRRIRWPGGPLLVNADAHDGVLKARVSDERRKPIAGYDYDDCRPFSGDTVRHEIAWGGGSLDALRGQVIRLEFYLENADLYTFVAGEEP